MELRNQNNPKYKIDESRKVFIYKNLHKNCWSLKQDGLVKAHTHDVSLFDCSFRVNQKGREKVLEEKRKNVHAGLSGYYVKSVPVPVISFDVTYNPYKYETFVNTEDYEPQEWSEYAYLERQGHSPTIEAIFTRKYFQKS